MTSDASDPTPAADPGTNDEAAGSSEDSPAGEEALDAARDALARAQAAARGKGLRPGLKPRRRRPKVSGADQGSRRDPTLIGDEIDQLVTSRGWMADVSVGSVIGRWPEIVGPEIAAHCLPTDFVDGVLTVRAESTAWATQLRMLASSLLARLTADVGEGVVTEVRIVGPNAPTWSRGRHRVQDGRGPRDTYG